MFILAVFEKLKRVEPLLKNKNVIPSTYILVFDIQIKARCVKWLK